MADSSRVEGYRLREQQLEVLGYTGGRMAISAVPGAGKTLTLALLAARLITEGRIGEDGEVLVVTVQNSAVDNISQRIRRILVERKLGPVGYRVCTLHKLASDIVHMRPDLAHAEDGFHIVDESDSARMMHNAAEAWIASQRGWWLSFVPEGTQSQRDKMQDYWRHETERVGREVTRLCKHARLLPERAAELASMPSGSEPTFLSMGVGLYQQYERYLWARSGLDFDDLIWRAIDAIEQDSTFLARLRAQWPYILEDEAQDSSPLQEQILGRLCWPDGNWVRVGDPNQAINSSFTAADPRYLRRFAHRPDVRALSMPASGRSGRPIIALANYLVRWVTQTHPEPVVRDSAFQAQDIQPTPPGDYQPNPPDDECHVHIRGRPFADEAEQAREVVRWAADYARRNSKRTVAILCPTHYVGLSLVRALSESSPAVPFDDLLRSTPQTRDVARLLATACRYLGDPTSRPRLAELYSTLVRHQALPGVAAPEAPALRHHLSIVRSLAPHELLFPYHAGGLQDALPTGVALDENGRDALQRFSVLVSRWMRASALPIDQLVLTIAQDLFQTEDKLRELAICHTIAGSLAAVSALHPVSRLADLASEFGAIAEGDRRIGNLSLADAGYVAKQGRVAVTTMHKAKGLEWDAVFLVCVDNLEFPHSCEDAFRDEMYFMPGRSPAVEARMELENLANRRSADQPETAKAGFAPPEGVSLIDAARLEYIAERQRLLYVCVTRAQRDLCLAWCQRRGASERSVGPAQALLALQAFQQGVAA